MVRWSATVATAAVVLLVAALVAAAARLAPVPTIEIAGDLPTPAVTDRASHAPPAAGSESPAAPPPTSAPAEATTPTEEVAVAAPPSHPPPSTVSADAPPAPPPPPPSEPPPPTAAAPAPENPGRAAFEQAYPAHAAAIQNPSEPATTRWAVLIGINEHHGSTRDNVGSRQDAEALAAHLRGLGWRDDHLLVLTDHAATRTMIVEAIRWLQRKTDGDSVAVFHYSGHTKQWPGRDVDGDGEVTDEALWPTDNAHIVDGEFTALMGQVGAGRLWVNIAACEAAGYADPGLGRDGRLLTFSAAEDEKAYEDPPAGHSVWGQYLIREAFLGGAADRDGDGEVSVEEAALHAIPRAAQRTSKQRYGAQNGIIVDRAEGPFLLTIPDPSPR